MRATRRGFLTGAALVAADAVCGAETDSSVLTFADSKLVFAFDLHGATPSADGTYVKDLLTVKNADAAAFENKIRVMRPFEGVSAKVSSKVSGDYTTFTATIERTGLMILFR